MKRLLNIFALTATILLGVTGCLNLNPADAIPEEKAMTTLDEANQVVVGIYADLKSGALHSGLLTLLPDIQSDLVYAVEGFSNTYGDLWRWEILSTNPEIESVYAALYRVIADCNYFFDYLPQVKNTLHTDSEIATIEGLEGEVHFARALCYSELIKLFCKAYDPTTAREELGVVLVDSYKNKCELKRASLYDSYQFVLGDLAAAIEKLDIEDVNNYPYFTKEVAYALRARVSLYMQDWDQAIADATYLIGDGEHKSYLYLSSTTEHYAGASVSDFDYMWTADQAFEIIFKVGFTTTSYGGALGRIFLNYNYVTYTPDYIPSQKILDSYETNDLRYSAYFRTITTGYSHGLTYPLLTKYEGNADFRSIGIQGVCMPKLFRLAEQYLIRAEAYCNKNEFAKASKDLTTLRKARYKTYSGASLTKDNYLDVLSAERAKELFMEGFRLQDLKRWGKGFTRTPQTSTVKNGSSLSVDADNPLFVWPIPQHELESPGAAIQPNESNK